MATKKVTETSENEAVVVETVEEPVFDKKQLTSCTRYSHRRDLVNALLEDGKTYTITQVDQMISDFDNGDFTENKERNGE
jgi:hypothetical protein